MLSSQWERSPNHPPPRGAVPPVSTIRSESFQLPKADCPSPSCLLRAMVSAATFGLWEETLDRRFQYRRKSSRCYWSRVSGCTLKRVCCQVWTTLASRTRRMRHELLFPTDDRGSQHTGRTGCSGTGLGLPSCFHGFLAHLKSYEIFTKLVNSSSDFNRFITSK